MTATEKFVEAACNAGILQSVMNGMILTGIAEHNDTVTRKAVSAILQKQLIENPTVLKAFNDFAREVAYEVLIDNLFKVADIKQKVLNNDPDIFIKILFKG